MKTTIEYLTEEEGKDGDTTVTIAIGDEDMGTDDAYLQDNNFIGIDVSDSDGNEVKFALTPSALTALAHTLLSALEE